MKKIILFMLVSFNIVFAQYFGERTTEQSFESSALHFNSHYLNPFGIVNFRNVTPGLIDNPFLNLYINPANLPGSENELLFYLEFRGDRTEPHIMSRYILPNYFISDLMLYRPFHDPRWFMLTRSEPEPILSAGVITYPLKGIADNLFIGGTYQLIHKEEKFYTMPYWIYYPNFYYDALGIRAAGLESIPIHDRYSGKDEMINEGHLFSAFTGYKINDELSIGALINGVIHSRDGDYLNSFNDEYNTTNSDDYSSYYSQGRNQDYNHLDFNGGINFQPAPQFKIGVKAGILIGEATQDYNLGNSYYSKHNTPEISSEWYYYTSNSATMQNWKRDGTSKYIGINFLRSLQDDKSFSGYYRFTKSDIDLTSNSLIIDTSYYTSLYRYDNRWHRHNGYSSAYDIRSSTGNKNVNKNEGALNFRWVLTKVSSVILGFYFNSTISEISINEPVIASRTSSYNSSSSDPTYYNYNNYYKLVEDKILEWNYKSDYWTVQIPLIFDFRFNENWGMMLGLNRILESWEITDVTIAYFSFREKIQDTVFIRETNFGERYSQPVKKFTEDFTKIFAGFDVSVSEAFNVRLILDPEFEYYFRISQWWLNFQAML